MQFMLTVIIRMSITKVNTSMVYTFDPLQIECLMRIDHKYSVYMIAHLGHKLFIIICIRFQIRWH
jgi:hypothetical protein